MAKPAQVVNPFKKGDRVRPGAAYWASLGHSVVGLRRLAGITAGTVVREPRSRGSVIVKWDELVTPERVSITYVELLPLSQH